jgi:hypothetical protein
MKEVKIVRVGEPNPKNSNCGYHAIGFNDDDEVGFIFVWFSDLHDVKTAEQAMEIAEGIVKAMNELRIIKSR